MAVAMPPSPDHAPMARPRSSVANDADTIARLFGTTSAAATPCTHRAAINELVSGAIAHSSDVSANETSPISKIRRRP